MDTSPSHNDLNFSMCSGISKTVCPEAKCSCSIDLSTSAAVQQRSTSDLFDGVTESGEVSLAFSLSLAQLFQ